jgi:Na+-translocating ferredoxin:NAD+ oxidoreductase subunit B
MIWLDILICFFIALAVFWGTSFLSSAWRKLKKTEPETQAIAAMLPGYDCGLCGKQDCRSYALAIDQEGADPALCGPGGQSLESRLRARLGERPGDPRALALRAVVRCGGRRGAAAEDYPYDGLPSCRSAVELYGGPKLCEEGCLGFGSCVSACPALAIRIVKGLAVVDPALCTGCGACIKSCPTGVIELIPREQAWYVACSSHRDPELRSGDCSSACTACGECARVSVRGEFALAGNLASENPDIQSSRWQEIAERCPSRCIVLSGTEKKRRSPFPES